MPAKVRDLDEVLIAELVEKLGTVINDEWRSTRFLPGEILGALSGVLAMMMQTVEATAGLDVALLGERAILVQLGAARPTMRALYRGDVAAEAAQLERALR